jgi:GNAT superfamily N-acetyltransferase
MSPIPISHQQALSILYPRLADLPFPWLITGSVGMALQGMPVEPHDIDLQTSRAGAQAIAEHFPEFLIQPVGWKESPRIRSEYGVLEVAGVKVEIMGNIENRPEDGDWVAAPPVTEFLRWVDFQGMRLPVADLEYECTAYQRMGRVQKAQAIRAFLGGRGLEIRVIPPESLSTYAQVPISFTVRSVLRPELVDEGLGGIRLVEEAVETPYIKDYDEGEPVTTWPERFDMHNWTFFLAEMDGRPVGGATLVFGNPDVDQAVGTAAAAAAVDNLKADLLEGRTDLAELWDIRVHPDFRGQGVGQRLFQAVVDGARAHGRRLLKIETQNVNVSACRFYARMGARLGAIHRYGYANPKYAAETMLLWYKEL